MAWHVYHNLYFTTATILEWKHLFKSEGCCQILTDSFKFLRTEERAYIHAFVIMPNHIHLIWTIPGKHQLVDVKAALLSFTGHQFKKFLAANHPAVLEKFRVDLTDRKYQFWERNALSVPIFHDKVLYQKMKYIHENPCREKWKLAATPTDYRFSSAWHGYPSPNWEFVSAP